MEGIVADARTVRLGRRFDAVLLASHLVNDPDGGAAFVATAAAHVTADGVVIGETYPPDWDPAGGIGQLQHIGAAQVELLWATVEGDRLEAEVRYGVDGSVWGQVFRARLLNEGDLRGLLLEAGLAFERWLDRPGWFTARPTRTG